MAYGSPERRVRRLSRDVDLFNDGLFQLDSTAKQCKDKNTVKKYLIRFMTVLRKYMSVVVVYIGIQPAPAITSPNFQAKLKIPT